MKTKTINLYNFNELSKEAKQHAIARWYEQEDFPFLTNDLEDSMKELDKKKVFSNVRLQYSLSHCQGDGLSFSADIDLMAWLNGCKLKKSIYDAIYNNVESLSLKGNVGHYCYASRNDIKYDICGRVGARLEKIILDTIGELEEYYIDICRELEKIGYSIIDYRMNEEEFNEHCEVNGYTFLVNGEMEN